MTGNSQRQTATIYKFPVGGRSGLVGLRETTKPASEFVQEATSMVAIGGSWYHEEAIREADKSRKH
jgi:hypothetical protein